MINHLHIITFDIPFPPTYGGAIDVFYRLEALAKHHIAITLHCFYKGELRRYTELESLCQTVYYYPRKTTFRQMLHWRPYAVISRKSEQLLNNLLQDNDPILFEGLVTCGLLNHPLLRNRKKYLRECNIEHHYFYALAKAAHGFGNKLYYFADAIRLKCFEKIVNHANGIFAIAHQDEQYFKQHYPHIPTTYLAASHPNSETDIPDGLGTFILYHGNLDVSENYNAAELIIRGIAAQLPDIQFVIAGRYHNHYMDRLLHDAKNVRFIPNPDDEQMKALIHDAQIHLLITEQATGLKLKLLNVLYKGRHVIANEKMVEGTDVESLCHVASSYNELAKLCRKYMEAPISDEQKQARTQVLDKYYNNNTLCQILIRSIFN
jgi:glycosyltransferase involved in cell wall biosynthesis